MFEIKWGKRVLLTIIWDHKKWHAHLNPVKKPKPPVPYPGEEGIYPNRSISHLNFPPSQGE